LKIRIITDQVNGIKTAFPGLGAAELGKIRKLGSTKLGVFQECSLKCPSGWEKVVIRKPDLRPKPGREGIRDRGICLCRLDPSTRRKTPPGHDPKASEEKRKPFGSEKKPYHARRKEGKYGPGLLPRDIRERS